MWKTIARRILILIPQLLLLSFLIFLLALKMPGDALTGKIDDKLTAERVEELRQMYGFYDPWYVRYGKWLGNAVKGDFGNSIMYKIPVTKLIGERAVNTFWLSLLTIILAYMLAIPLGIISGRFHDKLPDRLVTFYTFISLATPTIILALIFIYIFGFKLKWFPTGGSIDVRIAAGSLNWYFSKIYYMILPAITGALLSTVGTVQYLRSEIIDFEQSDFVVTARSKGVPSKRVYSKHIFRNALIPIVAFLGYSIAGLLTGSVFIENTFTYPGIGRLFIEAISKRDYSVVNALIIMFAVLIVLGNLISDIVLSIVDPRIRIK